MLGIFEARVAGKQSYDFFLELGDLRGQAAALLVQSHVCIKSKNQDKDREPEEHTLNHNSVWLCHQTCINSKTWNSLYIYIICTVIVHSCLGTIVSELLRMVSTTNKIQEVLVGQEKRSAEALTPLGCGVSFFSTLH